MRRNLLIAMLVGCGHSTALPVPASTPGPVIEEWLVEPADEGLEPARVSRDDPSFVPSTAPYIDANVLRARREPSGVKFQIDVGTDTIRELRAADFIDDAGHVISGPKFLVFLSGPRVSVGTVRGPSARVLSKRVRLYRPADAAPLSPSAFGRMRHLPTLAPTSCTSRCRETGRYTFRMATLVELASKPARTETE